MSTILGTGIEKKAIILDYSDMFGFNFKIDLSDIVSMDMSPDEISEHTDEWIMSEIDKMAGWRQTLWTGFVKMKRLKDDQDNLIEILYAGWEGEARKSIIDGREDRAGKMSTSFIQVSKEELRNEVLRQHKDEWTDAIKILREYETAERMLYGTWDNIKSRGMELQSILKGKKQPLQANFIE